jgi:hypothetical protein
MANYTGFARLTTVRSAPGHESILHDIPPDTAGSEKKIKLPGISRQIKS